MKKFSNLLEKEPIINLAFQKLTIATIKTTRKSLSLESVL